MFLSWSVVGDSIINLDLKNSPLGVGGDDGLFGYFLLRLCNLCLLIFNDHSVVDVGLAQPTKESAGAINAGGGGIVSGCPAGYC